MAKHTLVYFNFDFWRAEAPRLILHVGGIAFEDKRFGDREEFAALKSKGAFPFGSVPVLHIEESDITTTIAQSPAIMRYAGKLCGMYPEDPVAAALVDQVSDTIVCLARGRCGCRACTGPAVGRARPTTFSGFFASAMACSQRSLLLLLAPGDRRCERRHGKGDGCW